MQAVRGLWDSGCLALSNGAPHEPVRSHDLGRYSDLVHVWAVGVAIVVRNVNFAFHHVAVHVLAVPMQLRRGGMIGRIRSGPQRQALDVVQRTLQPAEAALVYFDAHRLPSSKRAR